MSGPNIDATPSSGLPKWQTLSQAAGSTESTARSQIRPQTRQPIFASGQLPVDSSASLTTPPSAKPVPHLPDPEGQAADPHRVTQVLQASQGFVLGSDAVFDTLGGGAVAALDTLAQKRHDNIHLARTLKNLHNQQQVAAKFRELIGKQSEVHGQRISSNLMFFASTAASLSTLGLASFGGYLKQNNPQSVLGPSLRKIAQPVGHALNQAANFVDTNIFGRREAQLAQIEQKEASIHTQIAQNAENNADTWLNQVQEQRKQALQALMAQVQMWGQSLSELWR